MIDVFHTSDIETHPIEQINNFLKSNHIPCINVINIIRHDVNGTRLIMYYRTKDTE